MFSIGVGVEEESCCCRCRVWLAQLFAAELLGKKTGNFGAFFTVCTSASLVLKVAVFLLLADGRGCQSAIWSLGGWNSLG